MSLDKLSPTRTEPLPPTMRALVLDGRGVEHLGLRRVPTPRPGPRQLVCRVDAAGVCTSVNKLIEQGPDHPLMHGWDPSRYPVILGDEGAVTVLDVGTELRGRFETGQRFAVQPAVDHAPITNRPRYRNAGRAVRKIAVGYTLPGLLAEYVLIGEEVLAAGCLVPIPDGIPYSHSAIAEPLSCVVSSHAHHLHLTQVDGTSPRKATIGIGRDSIVVIIGAGPMGRMHLDLALAALPRAVVIADLLDERLEKSSALFSQRAAEHSINLTTVNSKTNDLVAVVDALTDGRGADDVIVAVASSSAIEGAQHLVARYGVLNLFGGLPATQTTVAIDGRLVHYREINITGSSGGGPWDLRETLDLMAKSCIDPALHIAHIGDLGHAAEALEMARDQGSEGKAVLYPHRPAPALRTVPRWDARDELLYLAAL
jgi:threonine dehydrogenase-like Zn-dependent dehydrogenase